MFREIIVVECENWKKCVHCMANAMLLDVMVGATTCAEVAVRCFSEKKRKKEIRKQLTCHCRPRSPFVLPTPLPHVGVS